MADDAQLGRRVRAGAMLAWRRTVPAAVFAEAEEEARVDAMAALSVFVGAGLGALLRWGLGSALNPLFPNVPLGTLAANLVGGFLMGLVLGLFVQFETLPPALRLAVTTGFLGGLTTFSTFSAETTTLLLRGQYGWASVAVAAHVVGSLLATLAGILAVRMLLRYSGGGA